MASPATVLISSKAEMESRSSKYGLDSSKLELAQYYCFWEDI